MAKVTTTFVSDEKSVIDAIAKMNGELVKLQEQNKKLADESKKNAKAGSQAFDEMQSSIAGTLTGYVSMQAAASAFNRILTDRITLEKELAGFTNDAARQQKQLRLNVGLLAPAEGDKFEKGLTELAKKLKVPELDLYGPAGGALSGASGDTVKALQSVEQAMQLAKGLPAEAAELASGIANLQKATGGDVSQATALMAATGQYSNIKDWQKIGRNTPGAIIGATNYGMSPATAAAAFATITQASGDTTGESSATATLQLAQQIREFFPEEATYTGTGRNKKLKSKGYGKMSTDQKLEMLLGDPALLGKFKEDMKGEIKAIPGFEQMLTPGSDFNKTFMGLRTQIASDAKNMDVAGFGKVLERGPLQQGLNEQLAIDAVNQRAKMKMVDDARSGRTYEAMNQALEKSGTNYMERTLTSMEYGVGSMFGADTQDYAAKQLQNRLNYLRASRIGAPSEKQKTQEDLLVEMIGELRGIKANQQSRGVNADVEGR